MLKLYFNCIFLLIATLTFGQNGNVPATLTRAMVGHSTKKDTTVESDTSKENKEPRYYYLSVNTNVLVNTRGGAAARFSPAIEIGRTYGIFDIGLATGMVNFTGHDTTHYVE